MWREHALRPPRLEGYKASTDSEIETKAAEIIGHYRDPLQHDAVFYVGERTAIQALNSKDPVLPLFPGRAERHGFKYYRHGTAVAVRRLQYQAGEVLGKTATRHASAQFVAFLADIVASQPRGKEIRLSADARSAHKRALVRDFLAAHPKGCLHFAATYSSWLGQVELCFGKIERDVSARGVFTSVPDLQRTPMRYIGHNDIARKTVKWKYFDPTERITSQSAVTVHHSEPRTDW